MRHLLVVLGCLWAVMAWGQETYNSGIGKVITNVADGIGNKDAMNVGQVRTKISEYNALRGQRNLITNGFALSGTNYNFSTLTYSATDGLIGIGGGAFTANGTVGTNSDEFVPINTANKYMMTAYIRSKQGLMNYIGITPYDIDKLYIDLRRIKKYTATLQNALNVGDMTVTLTANAPSNNYGPYSYIANPSYVSTNGYNYTNSGYSRTITNIASMSTTSNIITLSTASNFSLPAGATIYLTEDGANHIYISYGVKTLADNAFQKYSGTLTFTTDARMPFVAYARPLMFLSYSGAPNTFVNAITGFELVELDPNSLQAVSHTTDFTGDGASTPLALATPYLPLTSTTPQTVAMGANKLTIAGSTEQAYLNTKIIQDGTTSAVQFSDNNSYSSVSAVSGGAGITVNRTDGTGFQGAMQMISDATMMRPRIWYNEMWASPKARKGALLMLPDDTFSGVAEWNKPNTYGTFAPSEMYSAGTNVTIDNHSIIYYAEAASGSQSTFTLPDNPAFCDRIVRFIKWTGAGFATISSPSVNIIAGGSYNSNLNISGNNEFHCRCQNTTTRFWYKLN